MTSGTSNIYLNQDSSILPTFFQNTEKFDSESFPGIIKKLTLDFQKERGKFLTETVQLLCDKETGTNFYGIHRDQQMVKSDNALHSFEETEKRYSKIKSHLLEQMCLQPNTPIYQVVGDSAPYGPQGTQLALQFLEQYMPPHAAILYGYTGHDKPDGRKCVNAAVSAFAEKHGRLRHTIGNLVGFHTPAALESWGCSGPQLNHYFLVYGDDDSKRETGTVFGDDITTSDFISDELLMVEGGIQSFRQGCNFLMLRRPILGYTDLRRDSESHGIKMEDGTTKNYFSAPEFLWFLKQMKENAKSQGVDITDNVLDGWYNAYLSNKLLSDPKRQDYDTKKKLLDDAWKLFKGEKLYKQLHLFRLIPSASDFLGKAYFFGFKNQSPKFIDKPRIKSSI